MMFGILMALSMLVALLLQAQLPGMVLLGGVRWPVLCSLVMYYSLNHHGVAGAVCAFACGLLIDSLSLVPLGYSGLLLFLMSLAVGACRKHVLPEAMVTAVVFGGLGAGLYAMALYALLANQGLQGVAPSIVVARIAGSGVLGAITAPPVFWVLARLHRALELGDKEAQHRVNA